MAELSTRELSTRPDTRELSIGGAIWPGWDPVPEWDGFPPEEPEQFSVSHHRASMQGKIAAAAMDGDAEAALFEFGGY